MAAVAGEGVAVMAAIQVIVEILGPLGLATLLVSALLLVPELASALEMLESEQESAGEPPALAEHLPGASVGPALGPGE